MFHLNISGEHRLDPWASERQCSPRPAFLGTTGRYTGELERNGKTPDAPNQTSIKT